MVVRYILDTDTTSLYQRRHPEVSRWILLAKRDQIAVTAVRVEEQMVGRLATLRGAKTNEERVVAYQLLSDTAQVLGRLHIVPFSLAAMKRYEALLTLKLNIGKYDQRIAAITLENTAILVTRNVRDFARVPNLVIENWAE